MIRNYFKIAWRNLKKNRFYSMINIAGLALGMFCSLLIWLWVKDEMSYDRFYPGHEGIYYVRCNGTFNGDVFTNTVTPAPLADALKKDVPEVAYATKLSWNSDYLVSFGEKAAKESGLYASDDFFDVFQLPVIAGDPKEALASPDHIVITRNLAEKYFPDASPLGQTLRLNNDKDYAVGAVVENIPSNSSIQLDWVVNFKEIEEEWMQRWGNYMFRTYVRLQPEATKQNAEANMKGIYPKYAKDIDMYPILQPLKDVRLYSDYKNGKPSGGGIEYVRIFMIVALFILAIACINFMNMATARSSLRAKEVGIRKVVGAAKRSLFKQFISESILTSLMGLLLALILVWISLPAFNRFFGKQITLDLTDPVIIISLIALLLITGFLSGSYPALYLSAISPIHNLKNKLRPGYNAAFLRKSLVVFQFTLSVFLIISMIVISGQMQYLRSRDLGLDQERVLSIPLEGELYNKMETFRQEVIRSAAIESATTTALLPINIQSQSGDLSWPGKDPDLQTSVSVMTVGYDFIKTMNIELVDGRDFSKEFAADSTAYLINESTAKLMGKDDPVGQQIKFWNGNAPVIGVMKDFHLQSLHMPITPLILCLQPMNSSYMLVKARAGKTAEAIADLQKLTKKFNPNYPFEYHFLDAEYDKLYKSDTIVSTLIRYFGILAILISGMGLLALAAFTAEQRTKEIGIRKVLGASVAHIVTLLSGDFTKLVFIAIAIASPMAWYAMHRWLSGFAYQIELEWWMFALAGFAAIFIALITVSGQSIKAAVTNPVKSLRTE